MQFESPSVLGWLLAVPLILLFGLWRTRPAAVIVPSLRLWGGMKDRHPPVRELRRPAFQVSLLLQALSAALLVTALAGPRTVEPRPLPRALFVLLDDSASLGALDEAGRSRWEAAREAVRALVAQAAPGDRIVLVRAHAGPGGAGRRSAGPPGGVVPHLDALRPSACGEAAVVHVARLLAAECGTGPGRTLVVVSDHAAADVAEAVAPAAGRFLTVGGPVRNAGILAFACELVPGGGVEIFLRCAGPAGASVDVGLADSEDGASWHPLGDVRVLLDGRGEGSRAHRLVPAPARGILQARLAEPDALEADDAAWLVRAAGEATVACFSARPGPLVRALQSIPGLPVEVVASDPDRPAPARRGVSLSVYDGVVPERLPEGHWVVLADPPASVGPFEVGEAGPAAPDAWRTAPPLTDHVDLPSIGVRRARRCRVKEGLAGSVRVLLESRERGPLLAWWDRAGGGVVYVGFDLAWRGDPGTSATAWALDPGFPIFWKNVVDAALAGRPPAGAWVSGRTCEAFPAGGTGTVPLSGPAGPLEAEEETAAGGRRVVLHRSGLVFEAGAEGRVPVGAAGLLDAVETAAPAGGGEPTDFRLPRAPEGMQSYSHVVPCLGIAGILLGAAWLLAARAS